MNRSTFPTAIDSFIEHFDIQASDVTSVLRFQELKLKKVLTTSERTELTNLTSLLRDKIFTPEDFNKMQDAIVNLETFFKDNVEGYIATKQAEMNQSLSSSVDSLTSTKLSFESFVDTKTVNINTTFNENVTSMESKKNYFIGFVDSKENEVRTLIQEFDSNSYRYYQKWVATEGQTDFNIYSGLVSDIPVEANLNISEQNIDLILNGMLLVPVQDYVILNNGDFDTIRLTSNSSPLVSAGVNVVGKWFKNVGKLYFKHASSHSDGGSDPITVTESMLDQSLVDKVNMVNKKITISNTAPTSPSLNDIWIDTN